MSSISQPPDGRHTEAMPKIGLFSDIPRWVWIVFLSAWALLFGLFVLFFATNGESRFAITIASLFALIAFGLPATLASQSDCGSHDCKGVIHTRSGPLTVRAAATQILLIPVGAVIGLTAFIILIL